LPITTGINRYWDADVWDHGIWEDDYLPYYTTGSGEFPALLFIDGNTAYTDYGIERQYADNCPNCRNAIHQLLAFNPFSSYLAIAPCPVCGQFILYLDNNGNLCNFDRIAPSKTTQWDSEMNVEDRY
jgi:hypothetical protein